jgi:hypothetical protein
MALGLADAAPPAPRAVTGEAVDAEEHTQLRPATAPLPADAFRDSSRTEPEPSVGIPLELAIPAHKPSKFRPGIAGLLAAVSLCAGVYFISREQQPAAPTTPIAPAPLNAAANASAPPARAPVAPLAAKPVNLDPPIGTTWDPDTAAEDEALLSAEAREARKAARVKLPRAVRKERPAEAPAAAQPESANAAPVEAAQQTPPSAAVSETPPPAAAAAAAADPAAQPDPAAALEPAAPVAAPPPSAPPPAPAAPTPAPVDRENPY